MLAPDTLLPSDIAIQAIKIIVSMLLYSDFTFLLKKRTSLLYILDALQIERLMNPLIPTSFIERVVLKWLIIFFVI